MTVYPCGAPNVWVTGGSKQKEEEGS